MNVTDITVRFMRRAQIREYEPIEAEVSLKAALAEGENYFEIANRLMADAKTTVHESGLKSSKTTKETETVETNGSVAAPAAAAEAPAKPRGRPPANKAASPPPPPPAVVSDPTDPTDPPAATKPAPAAAPAPADFDDLTAAPAPAAAPAAAPATMTLKELQLWTNANIEGNKITIEQVKGVWQTFGCNRSSELKPEQYGDARAKIEAIIAANAK